MSLPDSPASNHALLSSLNRRAQKVLNSVVADDRSGVKQSALASGASVVDFGVNVQGTIESGLQLARICMADLGKVTLAPPSLDSQWSWPQVMVQTDHPLLACIASQYAGWPLQAEDYFAMVSGPARAVRGREEILVDGGLVQPAPAVETSAVAVLESSDLPSASAINQIASDCQIDAANVSVCVAPTASLPGTVQVVARSVETAIHKLAELGFDLTTLLSGVGSAPLPPVAGDDLTAIGWTNDAIIYGGTVTLFVSTSDEAVEAVIREVPANSSSEFGKTFREIFEECDRDFYKIDKRIFSPAKILINNLKSGRSFFAGERRIDILRNSWNQGDGTR